MPWKPRQKLDLHRFTVFFLKKFQNPDMYSHVHLCFYLNVRIYKYIYIYTYFRWGRCLGFTRENPTRLYTRESSSFVHADADAYDGADGDDDDDDNDDGDDDHDDGDDDDGDDDDDDSRLVLSDPNCAVLSDPNPVVPSDPTAIPNRDQSEFTQWKLDWHTVWH